MTISKYELATELNMPIKSINMLIYSGALPKPNSNGRWVVNDITVQLDALRDRTARRTASIIENNKPTITSGSLEFPVHQR